MRKKNLVYGYDRKTCDVMMIFPSKHREGIYSVNAARGIKITIPKPVGMACGDPECRDLFGTQQHIPLLDIEIP